MGTAQAGPVEPEGGWQPGALSPSAPSPAGTGSARGSGPRHGLCGRIELEVGVLAPLSSQGKCSLFDLLCQITPLQQESERWTLTR